MQISRTALRGPEWLILIGALFFIAVLALSAIWEADIRWLHFFQAGMYLVTIVLSLRKSLWGYFIGISAAGLWDYMNLVATTFFVNGLQQLSIWLRTGHLPRPDLLIAVPAWLSNLLVIIGCCWAYARLSDKRVADLGRFLLAFVLTTSFFVADIAIFQPRYLALFPRMLHPHFAWKAQR